MQLDELVEIVRTFDGVLELAPGPGGPFPEISWGDHFFYYAPDGQVPQREQPFATVVTKDYPDDASGDLDHPDRWRLNIHVGRPRFIELTGQDPRSEPDGKVDFTAADVVLPHPVYRRQGWISIINPDRRTESLAVELLRAAHWDAARRSVSPGTPTSQPPV